MNALSTSVKMEIPVSLLLRHRDFPVFSTKMYILSVGERFVILYFHAGHRTQTEESDHDRPTVEHFQHFCERNRGEN